MADISMCDGGGCLQRENCYRYKATPNPWRQSYFMNPPWTMYEGKQVCTHLWPMEEEKKNGKARVRLRPDSV